MAKDIRIGVLHRGWVVVGEYERDGEEVVFKNAAHVRRWGTSKGLGELAASGPLKNTVLDAAPPVRVHALAVIQTIDCNAERWTDALRR